MRSMVAVLAAVLGVAGCADRSDSMRTALSDVDPGGDLWELRATCAGTAFSVDFRPGQHIAAKEIASASYEEIAVECGSPERVPVGREEGAPASIDMTVSSSARAELACEADGVLTVSVNPIWGERSIVGSSLMVERGGRAILAGSLKRDEYTGRDWSRLAWSRTLCRSS